MTPRYFLTRTVDANDDITHYQVFSGPGTPFEHQQISLTDDEFPNGPSNAILIVEATEGIIWTNPANLTYSPDSPLPPLGGLFEKPQTFAGVEIRRVAGFHASFADGSVRFLDANTSENILRTMISPRIQGN
jgi:hypothetical protein